jgi:Tfp pilus assembly protein PilX
MRLHRISRYVRMMVAQETGATVVIALLVSVVLALLGTVALMTSRTEVLIVGNDKLHRQAFYTAESGWQVAANWLASVFPGITDSRSTSDVAKQLSGDPDDARTWLELPQNPNLQYALAIQFVQAVNTPGYSTEFKRFDYTVDTTGRWQGKAEAKVRIGAGKVYYMGGY